MKLILWWSFASLLQVSDQQSKVCIGIPQQQKTLQTMLLFAACMPGLSGHDRCSFFMFLYDTVSLCYNFNSLTSIGKDGGRHSNSIETAIGIAQRVGVVTERHSIV